jgi:hypothetical protein
MKHLMGRLALENREGRGVRVNTKIVTSSGD